MSLDDPAGAGPADLDYVRDRVAECVAILSDAAAAKAAHSRRQPGAAPAPPRPHHLPDEQLLDAYLALCRESSHFAGPAAMQVGMLGRRLLAKYEAIVRENAAWAYEAKLELQSLRQKLGLAALKN